MEEKNESYLKQVHELLPIKVTPQTWTRLTFRSI